MRFGAMLWGMFSQRRKDAEVVGATLAVAQTGRGKPCPYSLGLNVQTL